MFVARNCFLISKRASIHLMYDAYQDIVVVKQSAIYAKNKRRRKKGIGRVRKMGLSTVTKAVIKVIYVFCLSDMFS